MFENCRSLFQRSLAVAGIAAAGLWLCGCGAFFQCEGKAVCGGTGTGGSTSGGDYAYVSNSASGTTYLNEYSIGSGALTAISGSPVNIGFTPIAMAVAPGNSYMYVAQFGTGNIVEFTIGSSGALASANNGQAVGVSPTGFSSSMDVSPDGNWLFALDSTGSILYEFPITKGSGLLGSPVTFTVGTTGTPTPQAVKVSPNSNYVACALGTSGTSVFPYSSSGGITSASSANITPATTAVGDFGVEMDTNNYLYVARTTGPAVYTLSGAVTATSVTQGSLTNGSGPHAIALSSTAGVLVYIGNQTDGTISAYSQSSGKLTNVTTTAYPAPTAVSSLARDNSAKYLIATGYNATSGTRLYTIGTGGALNDPTATASAVAATGTSTAVPALVAVTR